MYNDKIIPPLQEEYQNNRSINLMRDENDFVDMLMRDADIVE